MSLNHLNSAVSMAEKLGQALSNDEMAALSAREVGEQTHHYHDEVVHTCAPELRF